MSGGNSNGNGNGYADFSLFWARYPRRVAKQDALKAWLKLKPSPELLSKILDALDWQCELWTDPEYIPYPASWLRGHRWDDEPVQAKPMLSKKTLVTLSAAAGIMREKP